MFFSDMERKTLAITPPLLLISSFFFHLREAALGSSKAFHCLLLLSCLLLSSVNNLAEYDTFGGSNDYNIATAPKGLQSFNNGGNSQNVCPSSHLFSFLSALGLENQFDNDPIVPFFGLSCPNKSWSNPVLVSNNLSGVVVWLSLRPLHIIEFQPELLRPLNIRDTTCYNKPLSKELFGKKVAGELVSGKHCGGNGFSGEPGDSIKFLFFYQNDPDLELYWSSGGIGVLAVPMKATAPVLMLTLSKKTVFWVRTKKFSIAVLIVAALLILIFCFNDHFVHDEEDNTRNNTAVRKVEKPSTFTISPEMDSILRSISSETLQSFVNNGSKDEVSKNSVKSIEEEASEAVNLSVKTAKRRRNKKKKKSAIRELTSERTDVSSSHSGTSTPSSPMSPAPQTNQPTTKPVKPPKPVLSHSATFPVSGAKSMMMIERSSLAPNVRAPGTKPRTEEAKEEKAKEYDIWGDHLTWLNLMDRFKEVREGKSSSSSGFGEDDDSESFFVKGPQNLLADSHARFVSFCNQWG